MSPMGSRSRSAARAHETRERIAELVWRFPVQTAKLMEAADLCHGAIRPEIGVMGGGIMPNSTRDERIDLRISSELKRLIEQAATLSGMTTSNFIASTVVARSREVVREAETIRLSNRDRDIFLALLNDKDARPNAAMLKAARLHEQKIGS